MIKDTAMVDFIIENHTPIRAKLLLEAIEGILTYNVLDIVPSIEEIVLDSNLDTTGKIEGVKTEVTNAIKGIMHHIGINPYQNVNDFVKINKVIIAIDKVANEYWADYVLENTLLGSEEDSDLDKLYSVVRLTEDMPELDFYDVIHSIQEGIIEQLEELLESKVIPDLETDDPAILLRYREYISGKATGVVHEYITNGGRIGQLEHEDLLALFSEAIRAQAPADRPHDIVSAILISTCMDGELVKTATEWVEYFSDNAQQRLQIEREVLNLISK